MKKTEYSVDLKEFVSALGRVRPAVSDSSFVPVLMSFCFTPSQVFAYDDVMGISAPLTNSVGCAVSGRVWGVVSAMSGRELSVSVSGDSARLRCGRTSLTVPTLPTDAYIFKPPTAKRKYRTAFTLTEDVVRGLSICARFFSEDYSLPVQRGIIVEIGDGEVHVYSTDNVTASRYAAEADTEGEDAVVCLPAKFCGLLAGRDDLVGEDVRIDAESAWVMSGGGSVYTRLHELEGHNALLGLFDDTAHSGVAVTDQLRAAAARAAYVARFGSDGVVELSPGKGAGTTVFSASTPDGAIREVVRTPPPDAPVRVFADTFARAVELCDHIEVSDGRLTFLKGEEFVHVMSILGDADGDGEG